MPNVEHCIFTVGHSNHMLAHFIDLLKKYQIEVLADVRSHPYSRYAPQFEGQTIKSGVNDAGIKYLFMGKELGGRPKGGEFYDMEGHVLYSRLAESPLFLEGISRLERGVQKCRIAIMCSEENPAGCHRRLLVARVLGERGIDVKHIRGDGMAQVEADLAREEARRYLGKTPPMPFESQEAVAWRSIRSVLQREKRPNSSGR
jgi:uncharacterized protein (DUF488 family)